jgi:hypothetical protein
MGVSHSLYRGGSIKTVITSFTEQGYEVYGREFLKTFREFWPKDVQLVVYYEGNDLREDWRHIEEVEMYSEFMEAVAQFPIMSGKVGNDYKIDFDARMGRKTFMQNHAIKQYGGKVFWLDADTVTFDKVPETFLDDVLPDDKFSCFLGRDGWFYTESGFLGFNSQHPLCADFMRTYIQIFISGVIFTRKWWHDCAAYDAAREIVYPRFGDDAFINLAKDLPGQCLHPFVNSVLGAFMDHRKGQRKASRSSEKDLVVPRTEAYWNVNSEGLPTSSSIIATDITLPPSKLKEESSMRRAVAATAAEYSMPRLA